MRIYYMIEYNISYNPSILEKREKLLNYFDYQPIIPGAENVKYKKTT